MDETQSSSSSCPSTTPAVAIPDDVEALKQLVRELHEALHRSQRKIETLEHRLQQLLKARFGPRADRLNPNQLVLFATEIIEKASEPAATEEAKSEPRSKRNGHGRRKLPADLPRKQIVHDLSEEEKRCPCRGAMRERIGQETGEQLEYEPAKLYVIEHVRPTYACKQCEAQAAESGPQIITAPSCEIPISHVRLAGFPSCVVSELDMSTYYCHECTRGNRFVTPIDPTQLGFPEDRYRLEKFLKHAAPSGVYPMNSVFHDASWETYKDYMVTTAASGCLEIDERGRKNFIYFAGEETGLQYECGVFSSPCSGVKLVCSESAAKIHTYPLNIAPASRNCAICRRAVPFDPRYLYDRARFCERNEPRASARAVLRYAAHRTIAHGHLE